VFADMTQSVSNLCICSSYRQHPRYLSVNLPAPELTPIVKVRVKVRYRDRVRIKIKVRVSVNNNNLA